MNYHFRSCSEQPQQQQQQLQQQQQSLMELVNTANNLSGNNNTNNNPVDLPDQGSLNGIIRIHSDSQQSLDRLFNPSSTQATVPLRNRNLPASFFNPTGQQAVSTKDQQEDGRQQNYTSLHRRSTSFDHRRNPTVTQVFHGQHNHLHMRTQSTLAPMTGTFHHTHYQAPQPPASTAQVEPRIPESSSIYHNNGTINLAENVASETPFAESNSSRQPPPSTGLALQPSSSAQQQDQYYSNGDPASVTQTNSHIVGGIVEPQTDPYYSSIELVSSDTTSITDAASYASPPPTTASLHYQPSNPQDFYGSSGSSGSNGSSLDLPAATQINPDVYFWYQ